MPCALEIQHFNPSRSNCGARSLCPMCISNSSDPNNPMKELSDIVENMIDDGKHIDTIADIIHSEYSANIQGNEKIYNCQTRKYIVAPHWPREDVTTHLLKSGEFQRLVDKTHLHIINNTILAANKGLIDEHGLPNTDTIRQCQLLFKMRQDLLSTIYNTDTSRPQKKTKLK